MKSEVIGSVSLKQSYFNLLAYFFQDEKVETRYVKCLLKWGVQLNLSVQDLATPGHSLDNLKYAKPVDKVDKLEAVYHLVQMIYLDQVVEDVELEIASIYAEQLGFKRAIVGDLFKSIATRDYDGAATESIRQEVIDFLKLSES